MTESQGGNLLKFLHVESGRMVGALVPSKKSVRDHLKQAQNNYDSRFSNIQVVSYILLSRSLLPPAKEIAGR